ncbi:MAG: DUF2093 domain-containing protein [Sphingomonadales bacterium]|jgi:hypothetical protein|tara:strand:- start:133 stop:330 length:198 start_codon:yes stop_codon:yes gene_type:complete
MKTLTQEAKLYFGDGYFDIMVSGDHVKCAITGRKIHLNQLKYWSIENQEAYIDCATSALENKNVE